MTTLAILFGGRSCEHDVSVVSALQLMEQVDRAKYAIVPIYITANGDWYTGDALLRAETYGDFHPERNGLTACFLDPNANRSELLGYPEKRLIGGGGKRVLAHIDVAIPVFHGLYGEDGSIQGLLELANIPYASSGLLGSAVGMDKVAMKALFRGCGFPVVDGCFFDRGEWARDPEGVLTRLEGELKGYPMFVKPANLGSSIGISRADDREGLRRGIDVAVAYDRRILVERGVEGAVEINCAALGWGDDVRASVCEQPLTWESFLSFDDKYLRGGKGGKNGAQGMANLGRQIPAGISKEMSMRVQELTCDIFKALDCRGTVRVDFMIDPKGDTLYVNEINTIPGSMAFYLWEYEGLTYPKLIDKLVEIAVAAHEDKNHNVFSFDSNILKKYEAGKGLGKAGKGRAAKG